MPIFAQTEVVSFFSGTSEGLTYCLPDTRIEITVSAICITDTPGEFNRYAERYLRIDNAISSSKSHWEITDAEVVTKGIPNAEKRYTVKFNNSSASNIRLTEDGIIESLNIDSGNTPDEIKPAQLGKKGRRDATKYFTEEMLQATSTAKLAELTAREIYSIRESKFAIIRGEADNMPQDGVSMQLILKELEEQEMALTELFTGYTDTTYTCKRYSIDPIIDNGINKEVLFRFSRKLGFVDKEDLAGEPIYYSIRDLETVHIPLLSEPENKKIVKKEGICYNIPGKASITLSTRSRKLYDGEVSIAQFGTTEVLSKEMLGRKATAKIQFDTATGGIIRIKK